MAATERKRKCSPHQPTGQWIRREKRLAIYIRDGFRCQYCGRDLRRAAPADVTLDHLTPASRGGSNDATNLITTCRHCNCARQDRPWRRYATGGAVERIQRMRRRALNMALAKDIVERERYAV